MTSPTNREGLVVVDKPAGMSSHDVVARLRRLFRTRRVGHAGTLDPDATGVLLVCVGWATRLVPYLVVDDKDYVCEVRLGVTTDTDDASGAVLATRPVGSWSDQELEEIVDRFRGEIDQIPPAVSAIQVGGERAWRAARAGRPLELAARRVSIDSLTVMGRTAETIRLGMSVSKGTYVRSLARDLGEALGCGAHVLWLRRSSAGLWAEAEATSLSELEALGEAAWSRVHTSWDALGAYPEWPGDEATRLAIRQGKVITESLSGARTTRGLHRMRGEDGDLAAIVRVEDDGAVLTIRAERVRPWSSGPQSGPVDTGSEASDVPEPGEAQPA